ncbi:MAG TPA: transcriptional repressor [Spirochaetota bacterium]|nr:transcriptional repressor [Spirochaetota bacterium]HPJ35684.1 transcriptional repressor [Spirochaetota bacterium]
MATDTLKYRKSRQRERILEILRGTKSHPTADAIYLEMKDEFPDLSLGNVYRNLNILVETGMIQKLDFGSTFNRFDGNCETHSHFICEMCNSVSDLEVSDDFNPADFIKNNEGKVVKSFTLEFFGICEKCR